MTQEDSVSLQKEHNSAEILVCEDWQKSEK